MLPFQVKTWKMNLFTVCQVCGLALLWVVKSTALALAFLGRKREEFKALKAEISALELELNRASERREGGE